MKVISLLQPWASLVVIGAKKIETRSWNTKYRGHVLIHASKRKIPELLTLQCNWNFDAAFHALGGTMTSKGSIDFKKDLPYGQIIGSVSIDDSRSTNSFTVEELDLKTRIADNKHYTERVFGDYSPGRYGWLLSNPVQFSTGISVNGSLGIWNYETPIPKEIIKHTPFVTKKMARNVWVATCHVTEPLKCEVNQQGTTDQEAIAKLRKFLNS